MKEVRKLTLTLIILFTVQWGIASEPDISNQFINSYSFKTFDDIITLDSVQVSDCQIKDLNDIIRERFNKKEKNKGKKEKKAKKDKKISLLILPSFSVNPANGLMFGINSVGNWTFGDKDETRMSTANAKVVYTTKGQLMAFLKSSIYTKNDDYFLQGDLRYYIYSLPTYGIGTNAPDTAYDASLSWMGVEHAGGGGSYPMEYDYVIFHQLINRKIVENVYVGIGYQLDKYWNIKDKLLNLDTVPQQLTPHWTYSHLYGIDPSKYTASGFSLNLMYDSRDNIINPYSGYYFKLNYRYNSPLLGSTIASSELFAEFRTYVSVSKNVPRKLLAFWFAGNFQLSGTLPYYTLMALGDDQKGTTGRGYVAGRYRGESIMYGEVEYRFPFNRCNQTVGGVIFVNATTASNRSLDIAIFDYVRPAVGVGLRILVNKSVRLNISIDYAMGYKSSGFYFNSGDAF